MGESLKPPAPRSEFLWPSSPPPPLITIPIPALFSGGNGHHRRRHRILCVCSSCFCPASSGARSNALPRNRRPSGQDQKWYAGRNSPARVQRGRLSGSAVCGPSCGQFAIEAPRALPEFLERRARSDSEKPELPWIWRV